MMGSSKDPKSPAGARFNPIDLLKDIEVRKTV
jgi:hypothetical protein